MNICNVLMSKLYALTYKWVVEIFVFGVLPSAPVHTPWGASQFPYSVYHAINSFNIPLTFVCCVILRERK